MIEESECCHFQKDFCWNLCQLVDGDLLFMLVFKQASVKALTGCTSQSQAWIQDFEKEGGGGQTHAPKTDHSNFLQIDDSETN